MKHSIGPRLDIILTADAPFQYETEGGQTALGTLPRGTKLSIPASWHYIGVPDDAISAESKIKEGTNG